MVSPSYIYKAELFAIYYALMYISAHYPCQKICLYSDSLSSIASLLSGNSSSNPSLLRAVVSLVYDSGFNLLVVWVPSHVGIRGNEDADQAANEAADHDEVDIQLPWEYHELQNLAHSNVR